MAVAKQLEVPHETVLYIKDPPDRTTIERIVAALEDPVEDLVRKDSLFKKLGLNPDDYVGNSQAVIDLLVRHKQLLQRPVIVKGNRAIIGRPKERIVAFLR